jgi:hypothetical protein
MYIKGITRTSKIEIETKHAIYPKYLYIKDPPNGPRINPIAYNVSLIALFFYISSGNKLVIIERQGV